MNLYKAKYGLFFGKRSPCPIQGFIYEKELKAVSGYFVGKNLIHVHDYLAKKYTQIIIYSIEMVDEPVDIVKDYQIR